MANVLYACLILLLLGMSLRASLRLMYGVRGPSPGDPVYQLMNVGCWVLTVLPLACFIVAATNVLSLLLLSILAFSGLELVLAWRAMQRRSAWSILRGFCGHSHATTQALRTHQGRLSGKVGRSFRKLVSALEQGVSLPKAIAENRAALPKDAQAFAAIGAVAAVEPQADVLADKNPNQLADKMMTITGQQIYQRTAYLFSILLIMTVVVAFIAINIVPAYVEIFADFDLRLPPVTILLIEIMSLFDNSLFAVAFAVLTLGAISFAVVAGLLYLCDFDVLRPAADRLFFSSHRSLVLDLLAITAERGQPFVDAVEQLAYGAPCYPSALVRRRLRFVGQAMRAGEDWKEALWTGSIISRAEIPMLDTAQQAGNLPWALRTIAKQKTRSMIFRWAAFEQIAFPLTILFVGLVVGLICVGLFIPLVDLTSNLAY